VRRRGLVLLLVATAVASFSAGDAPAATTCSGAAVVGPHAACAEASSGRSVTPSPATARTLPVSACAPVPAQSDPPVCTFGAAPDLATATIALVGDSHAAQWRGALAVVARAKGWHGYSMAHSSCPLQIAVRDLPEPRGSLCATWKREVFAWFSQHPEVHTVFVAGLSGGSSVVPTRGRSRFATSVAGYADAWRALLPSVTRVIVIRDTPKAHIYTGTCVEHAVARHRDAALACAVPRSRALDPDPAIAAAASMPANRVQTVDLTRYFCGRADCYPVVGGVLVLRDETHMTSVFSTSLGPYLETAVDAALVRFADADDAAPTQSAQVAAN
jgi:hypothetical protein